MLAAALATATPAGECTRAHTRFALVIPDASLYVELDGCRQVLDDGTGAFWQVADPAALVAALD